MTAVLALAGVLAAQSNPGKPVQLPFQCTDEDIQWAGLTCSAEEPCPIYLELTAVEAVGNKLFATGNIHSQTVTLYSVLVGSDDSGTTWREAFQRIRGAGLDRVQFANLENGWASGESLSPLPQDPFLLITSDGGATWRQQAIFSESRVGSIQQIVFSSKSEGSLVFDRGAGSGEERYELYESHDGGETWNIKEANNRQIRLKEDGSPSAWRVQADGRTQTFHIEHQTGGRWSVAAAFTVRLGTCGVGGNNQ
jgi:hypothetical protein